MNRSFREILVKINANIYFKLFRRILVLYLLYFLCRLMFFLVNKDFYTEHTWTELGRIFIGGLQFDTAAIFYLNAFYILMMSVPFKFRYSSVYQLIGKYIYIITNSFGLLMNCFDVVYVHHTFQRSTLNTLQDFFCQDNLSKIVIEQSFNYWYVVLIFFMLVAMLIFFYGKKSEVDTILIQQELLYYPVCIMALLVITAITALAIHSGSDRIDKPITQRMASDYCTQDMDKPLVLNTPFSVLYPTDYTE